MNGQDSGGAGNKLAMTGMATMSAVNAGEVIGWLIAGCPAPVPQNVTLTLGALAIWAAHALSLLVQSRLNPPTPQPVPVPLVTDPPKS